MPRSFQFAIIFLVALFGATLLFTPPSMAGQYLTGRLLVAGDDMRDSRFEDTVILILEHDANGALGVVLNRVIGSGTLGKLIAGLGIEPQVVDEAALSGPIELRQGGPVDPNLVIVVHSGDYRGDSSEDLGGGVAWTRDADVLEAVAAGQGPEDFMIFFAYSGWRSGQLEAEFNRGSWLDADTDASIIFNTPAGELYDTVVGTAGLSM